METQIMTGGRNTFAPVTPDAQFLGKAASAESKFSPLHQRSPVQAEGARPHPSWPLENSSFFSVEPYPQTNREMSPFDSVFPGASGIQPYFLSGKTTYTNHVILHVNFKVFDFCKRNLTARHPASEGPFPVNTLLPPVRPPPEEDAMSTIPGFDHLAEDMAKHLELW